jgi:hypothetical protein
MISKFVKKLFGIEKLELEKAQAKRQKHNPPKELNVNSATDIINKKINERLKRKEMMSKEYDKWAKSQLDPTLDK